MKPSSLVPPPPSSSLSLSSIPKKARVPVSKFAAAAGRTMVVTAGAFAAAAILTPPDPISQIGLALPTLLLYEVSILSVKLVERQRAEREAQREAEDAAA